MYNHYIPGTDGVYQRRTVEEPAQNAVSALPVSTAQENKIPEQVRHGVPAPDAGDLLLICIVLLLLLDSDGEDLLPVLVTAAALLFGL